MLITEKNTKFFILIKQKQEKKSGLKPNICLLKFLLKNKKHESSQFYFPCTPIVLWTNPQSLT